MTRGAALLVLSLALAFLLLPVLAPRANASQTQPQSEGRPVVMVHGFGSTADAWSSYLGRDGYLASVGLSGFAVGDGQVEGRMNTGNLLDPHQPTNTIHENAEILGQYIANVKALTGAEQVDLIAHSMGGLISRYYVDRVMEGRDVAQLIMLGSPHAGTDCANLPAAAGIYLPAALEIRPSYVVNVFNRQITHHQGVPFYILAGTSIVDEIQSPCTAVPSDIVISLDSASNINATIEQAPVLHTSMNTSEELFRDFVAPLLLRGTDEIPTVADQEPDQTSFEPLQFTRIFTGHVEAGGSANHTLQIDQAAVANFALFDPTRSLTVTVRGASGNVIELDPAVHGIVLVDDPETMVHLGYGFNNPRPGPWQVTLTATERTPATGADYAISARLSGSAILDAQSSTLLPEPGERVELTARLKAGEESLQMTEANASIRSPDGTVQSVPLTGEGDERQATWTPTAPGLHAVDIVVTGAAPDGQPIERTAFLVVDVQPHRNDFRATLVLGGVGVILLSALLFGFRRWRKSGARNG
ncbi:MAG TPA: alpha/beta fold hydrolase [Ardenticatenaceae bacterium]|jgi:pimeloyl-ACP methyl ester carboxylesterase